MRCLVDPIIVASNSVLRLVTVVVASNCWCSE